MSNVEIRTIKFKNVKPHPRNPRTISETALKGLGKSIETFGYVDLMIYNKRTKTLIGGHQRMKAMQAQGFDEAEFRVVDMSPDREKALMVELNNPHIQGEWTPELQALMAEIKIDLADEYEALQLDDLESDLALILQGVEPKPEENHEPPPPPPKKAQTKKGDIWMLGKHRILCGDCTDPKAAEALMGKEAADMCFTDPPWNVDYGGSDHPSWKIRSMPNDNLGKAFAPFCEKFCSVIKQHTKPGAAMYMVMSAQEWPTIDGVLRDAGFHWSSTIIWAKDTLVLSRKDYHTQYEPIWYGWNADARRRKPMRDRQQSDLWQIIRPKRSEEHPTMKPVSLVARAILNSSAVGAVVLDPFLGSGTTIIAAEQEKRVCYGMEIEPKFCDVSCLRWHIETGQPIKSVKGKRFDVSI